MFFFSNLELVEAEGLQGRAWAIAAGISRVFRKHQLGNELTNILLFPERPNSCFVSLTCSRDRFGFPRRWYILKNPSWEWSITGTTQTASWAAERSWVSSQHTGLPSSLASASWKLKIKKLWRSSSQLPKAKGMCGMQRFVFLLAFTYIRDECIVSLLCLC